MENKNDCEDISSEVPDSFVIAQGIIIDNILEDVFEKIHSVTNGGRVNQDCKVCNSYNSNQSSNEDILEDNRGEDDPNINIATTKISIENNECSIDLEQVADQNDNTIDIDATVENTLEESEAPLKYLRDNIEGKGAYEILKLFKNEWFSFKDLDLSMTRLTTLAVIFTLFSWILR